LAYLLNHLEVSEHVLRHTFGDDRLFVQLAPETLQWRRSTFDLDSQTMLAGFVTGAKVLFPPGLLSSDNPKPLPHWWCG